MVNRWGGISVDKLKEPMPPPDNCRIISLTYDIGPGGATFEPPAVLTISYDESLIPEGVSEDKLVIAFWDADSGQWIELEDCVVDPLTNTITASVSHFTTFTVLARNAPASFNISALSISPAEVSAEGEVTISILVSNSGDLAGSYEVTLMIDNEVEETKEITLEGRSSGEVTFGVSRSVPGLYLVSVNGVPGSFAVVESVVVEGAQDTPAASTQIGEPVSSPIQPGTTNWWLIGAIFTADTILLVIIVMWLLKRRRKARQAEKEQAVTSYDLQMLPDKELRE